MRSDRSCCRRCSLHSLWIGSLWEGTDLAEGCTSGSARTRWHAVCIAVTQTMVCSTGPPTKNTSSLTSPSGWVQTLAAVLRSRASCQRYFVQTDILDGRPVNGETTGFQSTRRQSDRCAVSRGFTNFQGHWWFECAGACVEETRKT